MLPSVARALPLKVFSVAEMLFMAVSEVTISWTRPDAARDLTSSFYMRVLGGTLGF
jgi:hypothetical protein